jgi:hypothetical protein
MRQNSYQQNGEGDCFLKNYIKNIVSTKEINISLNKRIKYFSVKKKLNQIFE